MYNVFIIEAMLKGTHVLVFPGILESLKRKLSGHCPESIISTALCATTIVHNNTLY